MPPKVGKKTFKKRFKKRTRKDFFGAEDSYHVTAEPFPRVMHTKIKFSDTNAMAMTLLDQSKAIVYRCTSIWDPEHASGGTTCAGNAEIAAIYDRYQVLNAHFTVTFSESSGVCTVGYRVRLGGNSASSSSSQEGLLAQPLTYSKVITQQGNDVKTFKFNIKPWTVHGISKLEYLANSSAYTSAMNDSPQNKDLALVDIFLCDRNGTTTTVEVQTLIVYTVKFYRRKVLTVT